MDPKIFRIALDPEFQNLLGFNDSLARDIRLAQQVVYRGKPWIMSSHIERQLFGIRRLPIDL